MDVHNQARNAHGSNGNCHSTSCVPDVEGSYIRATNVKRNAERVYCLVTNVSQLAIPKTISYKRLISHDEDIEPVDVESTILCKDQGLQSSKGAKRLLKGRLVCQ